jgi:hypothetical protein
MRVRVVVASGLTVLVTAWAALVASAAHAAPPWSEPRSIGAPAGVVSGAEIGFGPAGTALLSRRTNANAAARQEDYEDRLATLTPDGKLVEHRPLSDRLAAPPLLFGRGRVALLRERLLSERDATPRRVRLSVSVGSAARPAGRGRPHRLASFTTFPRSGSSAMAVGAQGQIAIVWMAYRGDEFGSGRFRVRLALRRPNGRFDRTRTVASGRVETEGDAPPVAVAIGGRRDVVVTYAVAGIKVRSLRRGRRFDPPQALGPSSGFVELAARGSRTGRTVVAWATQDGGEEVSEPYVVRAALRAPRAARFGPTQVVDPGEANLERVAGRMRLAMAADGTAALTWSNASGRYPDITQPVLVSVAERDGGFGPFAVLAANGAARDVALRDDGAALVTWTDPRGRTFAPVSPDTFAALRPGPAQPFGPPELIATSSPDSGLDRQAAAAYDPRTGRPTVIWTATGGSDRLQLATRSG